MATMDGVGTTTFTGFSPALDLQSAVDADERVGEIVEDEICATAETTPLKILITHASDLRHVLKTLAFAKRHPRRAIHFYVYEKKVEVLARHLLFLSLVFDPEELTRREQIELFVEIYGNCMLREKTEAFISSRIHKLSKLITNQEGPLSNIVDFSTIKMKVKDEIENVVRAWAPNIPFEADKQRDTRLRQYYGDRYDYRPNVADWDYHMKLVGLTTIIHEKQYKYWRRTGQAFVIDDTAYPKPNRTLASETEGRLKGSSVVMRGFWCDIVNSPYLSFGISSENKSLFEKKGEQHTKTSVDVTEHNLSTYLKEILDISPEDRPEFKIFFGLGEPDALCGKSAYKNIFSIVYLSNMAVHYIKPALLTLLKPKARIVCETARYMLDLRPENKKQYLVRVYSLCLSVGMKLVSESAEEEVEVNAEGDVVNQEKKQDASDDGTAEPKKDAPKAIVKKKVVLPQENVMARMVFSYDRSSAESKPSTAP